MASEFHRDASAAKLIDELDTATFHHINNKELYDADGKVVPGSKLHKLVAISKSGDPSNGIETGFFYNIIPESVKNMIGVTADPLDPEKFTISNIDDYISEVQGKYSGASVKAEPLHPETESLIRDYLGRNPGKVFSTQDGAPGLHAEIRSVNNVYIQLDGRIPSGKIQVGTKKLKPTNGQGDDFDACSNCDQILPPDKFDILTGRSNGN